MTLRASERKRLWDSSGGRCAICLKEIPSFGDGVARAVISTTATPDDLSQRNYENHIILCAEHRFAIRSRSEEFTADVLREIKERHEEWVRKSRSRSGDPPAESSAKSAASDSGVLLPRSSATRLIVYKQDQWQSYRSLADIITVTRQMGGIIISPSDGAYGINVDPTDEDRVYLMRRLLNKPGVVPIADPLDPIPIVFDSVRRAHSWAGDMSARHAYGLSDIWPGPLTVLSSPGRARARRTSRIISDGLTFGLRQPSSVVERALVGEAGMGLTSMAVRDASGQVAYRADEAVDIVRAAMAREGISAPVVVIKDDRLRYAGMSTVVKLAPGGGGVDVIRDGVIPYSEVRKALLRTGAIR